MRKKTLEEAQKELDVIFPNKFKLLNYSAYKSKVDFLWIETGDQDSYWFFKFFNKTFSRFSPSKRVEEHSKIKLSFKERSKKIKSTTLGAELISFCNITQKCKVLWPNGEISIHNYTSLINNRKKQGSTSSIQDRIKQTCLDKYGVDHPSKDLEIALKIARKINNVTLKFHWKTNEELICQGGYESKVVDFLNANNINFLWQPKVFKLSNNQTYRPDMYLIDSDMWIEIKGYMREKFKVKWPLFLEIHPNSEIWNKEVLKIKNIL